MTKFERLLTVTGIAVVASAVLLNAYVHGSNSADAAAADCADQRAKFSEELDQVRFAVSAAHSVSTAVNYSSQSRRSYRRTIEAIRGQIARAHPSPADAAQITNQLRLADHILTDQASQLSQANHDLAQVRSDLANATPLVGEASQAVVDRDCTALSLTMAQSAWPKRRLLGDLSRAARINAQVSEQMESALGLILSAQQSARRYSVASK